ncbi:MAG: hypothetical protein HYY85_05745 [Deltaproteobacteria bacterium]|nr:hypothetical protein [Deltaproteobacteria bacterium]
MGPDIGYGGVYLNKQQLSRLKGHGVETVHVYRNRGDIIPALGEMSKDLVKSIPTAKVAEHAYKAVVAMRGLSTAAGGGTPMIRYREFEPLGVGFQNHYVQNYVSQRAGFLKGEVKPAAEPQDAKGVRIYIDDEILEKVLLSGTTQDTARTLQRLGQQLAGARDEASREKVLAGFADGLKARFKGTRALRRLDGLVAVSLKAIVTQAERYVSRWDALPGDLRRPGPITRIHGYAIQETTGDILILGSREGGAPIEMDDLTVGVCAVWKEGKIPLVSLDPDPANPAAPQKVRVQGIPRDSAFALTMLEADYVLKKLLAGVEKVSVAGYESLRDILVRDTDTRDFSSRFWLYPIQPAAGDIQISTDGNLAVFDGGAQVLSEEMVHTREGLVGTGKTFGPAERAAASATRYYPALAKQRPVFVKLQSLFDIVLLSKIWQQMNFRFPLLDRLCELPYAPAAVPDTYPAIRVEFAHATGQPVVLTGGVLARLGAGRRASLAFDDPAIRALASLARQASRSGRVAASLRNVSVNVPVADPAQQGRRELARIAAVKHLRDGDLDRAREQLSKLLDADPYDTETMLLRALTHFRRNDLDAARADAQRALELEPDRPDIVVLASLITYEIDALEGRMETGLKALDRALASDPGSVRARVLRASALARFGRAGEARAELRKAIELDPTSALAHAQLAVVELQQGWVAQGKKWATVAHQLAPQAPQVKAVLALAELFGATRERGERLAREVLAHPASDPPSKLVALIVLGALAAGRDDWPAVDEVIARGRAIAPFSPDIAVAMAHTAQELKQPAIARRYLQQAEGLAPNHPAVRAARQALGR